MRVLSAPQIVSDPLVSVELSGPPRGKGRPRFRVIRPKSGAAPFASVYTDADTAAYERLLAAEGRNAMAGRPALDEALTVMVDAFMPVPESWSMRKRIAAISGEIHHIGKPDLDNISKIALDSLNKIVWTDDSRIVVLQTFKRYSAEPGLRVSVWAWDDVGPAEPDLI